MKPSGNAQATTFDFLQPPRAADELGRLGPYRILRVIGGGAMGVVFLAEDTRVWRQVALKALKPNITGAARARQRFLREGHATADLKHDNVITIHDVGMVGDVPYLAMEFLRGESLDACLKRDRCLPIAEVLRIGREIAEGLAAAHDHGLVHRDVKPSNLWLEGTQRRVKVLDFGLARQTGSDQTNLTVAGVIVGTPSYMSPEQAKCETVDARADLFSLGCVLYRMATGDLPFKAPDMVGTLMALTMDKPVPPLERRPEMPPELNYLILRLLAKKPDRRPPTATVVAQALWLIEQRLADGTAPQPSGTIAVDPGTAVQRALTQADETELAVEVIAPSARKPPGRARWLVLGVVGAAALFVLVLFALVFALARPRDGTVSLDTDDNDVEIALLDQGREVAVLDRKNRPEVRLRPGEYDIDVRKGRDGLRLSAERVAVVRDGHETIRVTSEAFDGHLLGRPLVVYPPHLPGLLGWTVETREHRGLVTAVALSPDNKWLATGGEDASVRVWSYPEGELKRVLVAHNGRVAALKWYDDSRTLVSFGADKDIYLWELADADRTAGHRATDLLPPANPPTTFPTPGGKTLALENGSVLVREADKPKEARMLVKGRPAPTVVALAASPDGKTMASIHADKSIRLWDANTGKPLNAPKPAEALPGLLAWSPDSKTLAISCGPTVRLWDAVAGTETKHFEPGPLHALAWSPDSKWLALNGPQLQFWEPESGQTRTVKLGIGGGVAWAPDGKAVVVGGGAVMEVWDVNPDKLRVKCERPPTAGPVVGVAWSPDGKMVAEASAIGTRFYDPKTGKLLNTNTITYNPPPAVPLPPSWSPNGKTFVSGGLARVELREPPTAKSPHVLPPLSLGPVAYTWAADGRTVAFAQGGDARWFVGEARPVRGVMLSPGTEQAVLVLAMGHYRAASGNENDMVYVAQSAGEQQTTVQQTLTPAEFAKAYGWKNDVRWVRIADR